MLDEINDELEFILDSLDLISARISKINNPNDLVSSPDGITLLGFYCNETSKYW